MKMAKALYITAKMKGKSYTAMCDVCSIWKLFSRNVFAANLHVGI